MKRVKSYIKIYKPTSEVVNVDSVIKLINSVDDPREVSDILKQFNITFEARLNRLQSLILCELCDRYSIQSQRYCTYDKDGDYIVEGFDSAYIDEIDSYINYAVSIYSDMCNKGIPSEDARKFLPLTMPCYNIITMSADKLYDLGTALYENEPIFSDILEYLINMGLIKRRAYLRSTMKDAMIDETINLMFLNAGSVKVEDIEKSAIGALTCTNELPASEIKYNIIKDENNSNLKIVKNVAIKVKHESILEHTNYYAKTRCSLVSYNQLVRHRIMNIERYSWYHIVQDFYHNYEFDINDLKINSDVSEFKRDLNRLIIRAKVMIAETKPKDKYNQDCFIKAIVMAQLLPFGIPLDLFISDNLRNFAHVCRLRTCNRAQYEINRLVSNLYKQIVTIKPEYKEILALGKPGCLTPAGCPEGKRCCGDNSNVKALFE